MNDRRTAAAPALSSTSQSTLDVIAERILRASYSATEIGHKLNEHADALHGPIPTDKSEAEARDRAAGAIASIFEALDALDHAQAYMAEAAGRNTTLALPI